MIFKTITNDLNGAINKIGIFNRSFADLKNAISANGIKGLFNSISPAITSNDLSLIKEYNRLVGVEGVSSQSAWYRTMLSSSKSAQALFDDENNLIRTNNGLILSEEALARATNAMTFSAKAGKVALQALATVGNILLFTAITKGIQLAATAIDNWVHKIEKLRETAQNAIAELEDVRSKSESLNQELKTTNERITELENKPNLTFIEQEEIEKLRDASKELERQIELNKTLLSVQEGKTRDSALDYLTTKNSYEQYGLWDMSDVNNGNSNYGNRKPGDIFQGTQLEVIEQQLKEYEELLQRKEDVESRITDFKIVNPDEAKYTLEQKDALINLNMELQSYDDTLKILNDSLYEIIPNLDSYKDVLNPKYDQSYIDFINSLIDVYDSLFGTSTQTATEKFNDIWNSDSFSNYKAELEELAKAGKLDPEVLESNENYRKLLENTGKTAEETVNHIKALVEETSGGEIIDNPFSAFDGTEIGERLQYINSQFKAGEISYKEYFDALNSEIANVDFSNYTNSLEEANAASAQFFVDSTQQAASGLSDLINKFDSGSISVSEYLEGYLSIANTLSTLTDELQENSVAWNQNGNAMSDATSGMIDNTQSALDNAISTIQSYQDSIYSLEQLMTGAVEAGTDEFSAHTQVIAEDLANIVATGGQMADEIANTLGTTTSEIANSMSENVSNQSLAAQAITANTNVAISDMANSVGELFDTLGNAISNFKVDISFGIKSISMQDVDMGLLGTHKLPKIDFSLEASGESLSAIGSAISSFGKSVASNMAPQMIELPDFSFKGDNKYTPDAGVLDNYNKKLNDMKNAQKGAGKATKDTNDALKEQKEALEAEKEVLQEQKEAAEEALEEQIDGIDDVIKGKEKEIDLLDDEIDKIKKAREERKHDIEQQKLQYDLERMQNQRTKLLYTEDKGIIYVPDTSGIRDKREKIAELKEDAEIAKLEKKKDLIQDEIDALEEQKDLIRDMIEESNKYYDNLIKQTEKSIKELSKNAEDASKAAGNAAGNVGSAIGKLRDTLSTGKTLSYYIWTVQDEEVLANAKAGLENLNTLLEKNPENSHYAQLKDDVTNFVNELEKLKETRLVTDDFTNSLNTLKNSEDEYLKLFQDALAGVEERVNNTANYSAQIIGFVSPIADKTGELKQTLQTANEEVRNLGTNTSDVVNGISTSVDDTKENINRLTGTVANAVMKVNSDSELLDGSVTNLSNTVTRVTESASTGFNNLATDMNNTTASISQNAATVNNALDSMADGERFDNLTGSFNSLGEAILGVSMALGISEEGTVGGLVSAITAINEISLGGEEGGIIGQFHNLKAAVDEVSAAIAGGGSEGSSSSGKSSASGSSTGGNKGTGSNSGNGASSVTDALEKLLQTADKTIGNGDKSGFSDDGDTVIGKFGILKTAVNAVTEAIGLEEGAEGDEDLISALMAEFNTANEVLPQEEQLFNELEASIQACVSALRAMIEALREIDSIGVPGVGGGSAHAKGTVGSAFAEGTVGNAFATGTGYRGLPEAAKNALRSEYGQPELTLYPDGTTELTNQPIMSDLPKGTIIFNEEQTKKILNGEPAMRGKVYPTGAIEFENGTIARPNGEILTPLPDDDPFMIAQKKFEAYVQKMGGGIETVLDAAVTSMMNEHNKEVDKVINQLNAGNIITNNKNVQPVINQNVTLNCPNVTNNSGVEYIQKELGHLSLMAYQEPLKRY